MRDDSEKENIGTYQINWDEHATYWDDSKDAKIFNELAWNHIERRISCTGLRVLDFGCGTGLLTDHLIHHAEEIVAMDKSIKMIEVLRAKNHPNVYPYQGELTEEVLMSNSNFSKPFDLIIAVSVCAFVPNYVQVLKHLRTLLSPDGLFIQFDWLRQPEGPEFGFNFPMIKNAFSAAEFQLDSLSVPIRFNEGEDRLEVLMAVGKL